MTLNQVKALLKEASLEYLRTGANREEVEYYAVMLLEYEADGFVGK